MNLIRKHGLVPKTAYPESISSSSTRWMNAILKDILRSGASELRDILDNGGSVEEARAHKDKRVEDIWKILCIHLGLLLKNLIGNGKIRMENSQERKYDSSRIC